MRFSLAISAWRTISSSSVAPTPIWSSSFCTSSCRSSSALASSACTLSSCSCSDDAARPCSDSYRCRAFISSATRRLASVVSQSRRQCVMHATSWGRSIFCVAEARVRSCQRLSCHPSTHASHPRDSCCLPRRRPALW